jgi:hypothetical protein
MMGNVVRSRSAELVDADEEKDIPQRDRPWLYTRALGVD